MFEHITASSLLLAWDRGCGGSHVQRGLELMTLAAPSYSRRALEMISIGDRDRLLIGLRRSLFGSTVVSVEECSACQERIEIDFDLRQFDLCASTTDARFFGEYNGRTWCWRLPNSRDLLELDRQRQMRKSLDIRRTLFAFCLVHEPTAVSGMVGEPTEPRNALELKSPGSDTLESAADNRQACPAFPEDLITQITQKMDAADSSADIQVRLECAACQNEWSRPFDIVTYLWEELDTFCQRILLDVHRLARAYGWSEEQVLGLSPWRRQVYLSLVNP